MGQPDKKEGHMARKAKAAPVAAAPAKKTRKARAPKAVTLADGVQVLKSIADVGSSTPLGKAAAKVGHMSGGGPNADIYFGLTAKGGKPVYAIKKTGQRSGEGGPGSRHIVTLHTVDDKGTLSKPLATVKSVRGGWVMPS